MSKLKPGELYQCIRPIYTYHNLQTSVMNGKLEAGESFLIVKNLGRDIFFKRVTYEVFALASKRKVSLYLMDIKRYSKKITVASENT